MSKLFSLKKNKNHVSVNFLFFKFKFKINLKKYISHPVVVILGTFGIGDYIFYRPFFKYFKKSEKYKNATLIYLCRDIYMDFSEAFDSDIFDEIIPLSWETLNKNNYINKIVKLINSYNPDVVYSTTPIYANKEDYTSIYNLVKLIKAKEKIAAIIGDSDYKDKVFNKLIYTDDKRSQLFEADRVKKEFESILEMSIPSEKDELTYNFDKEQKYITITVSASVKLRTLSAVKWAEVVNYIINNTDSNTKIVFLGKKSEFNFIRNVVGRLDCPERCINLAGKINISLIPLILKNSEFLVSVETGTVHIAHEVGCKTICLAGSVAYGRFHPYNDNIIKYVYPEKFNEYIENIRRNNLVYSPPRSILT